MPSNVSQNPEAKRRTTAKIRSQAGSAFDEVDAYETAEANAKMKPTTLMLLGVKPILWIILASVSQHFLNFFLQFS